MQRKRRNLRMGKGEQGHNEYDRERDLRGEENGKRKVREPSERILQNEHQIKVLGRTN